jgi:hypothetical protein
MGVTRRVREGDPAEETVRVALLHNLAAAAIRSCPTWVSIGIVVKVTWPRRARRFAHLVPVTNLPFFTTASTGGP